ncbi:hypothetical protein HWV00_13475 [Moritella sp. 24]|uniref:hypothetical protein n=1 Tax=Moritella sp. 24 TaxID=2746230 RepID=UPI001BA5CBA3|nr:hypothetical protein [Moritella sp. 24]QUM77161.1 hypothetical protein HWV00_13475 [Moritella sp. 24]
MKKKLLVVALGLSSSIALVGCGGSDDTSSGSVSAPSSVLYDIKVIDGYLKNAQVWLDVDGDKQLDANEPAAYTVSGGVATLDVSNIANPEQYATFAKITVGLTVDESRGPVVSNAIMSAPPGEREITPLSTLVHIEIEQNTDGTETADELATIKQTAIAKIASDLGLQDADVLSDYIANGSGDVNYAAENIVNSKVLPEDTAEYTTIIADDTEGATFNKQIAVVSNMIKQVVDTTAEDDFDNQVSIFNIEDDLDTDTDGDGIPDALDALPNDASDWLDYDGDLIGNIADTDDDNDGVIDELDIDPLDPTLGLSEVKQVLKFIQDSGTFYTVSAETNNNASGLYVDGFVVNGDIAITETYQRIRADNSLASLPLNMASDILLTTSGWSNVAGGYTIDLADGMITTYPTNNTDISYKIDSVMSDLTGLNIAQNSLDDVFFSDDSTIFPEGATSASLNLTANQDTYSLSGDSPWILRGDDGASDGADAVALNELISDSTAGDNPSVGLVHAVSLGADIAVELVADNTANFYTFDFSETQTAQKIASATWALESLNGEEILSLTVPQSAIDSWNDRWEHDSPYILFSTYKNQVIEGSFLKLGESIELDNAVLMNDVAKVALVNAVDVDIAACDTGDIDSNATLDDFEQALSDCGGVSQAITAEMLVAQDFHRITNSGESRNHVFNEDGTVVVYKQGIAAYTQDWSVNGDNVVLSNEFGENNEESNMSIWALLDSTPSQWSIKSYDSATYRDDEGQLATDISVWSSLLAIQSEGSEYDCDIKYQASGASVADFNTQLAGCGILPEMDLAGNSIIRITGSSQTRSYVFNEDYTASYYRNGVKYNRIWAITDDGNLALYNGEEQPLNYLMRLVEDSNGNLKFAVYDSNRQSIWSTTYKAVDVSVDILACEDLDSDWDDVNNAPLTYRSYEEFKQAVTTCQDGKLVSAFSDGFIDQGITLSTGDSSNQADDVDTYQFNQDGTGVLTSDAVSSPMTWSMHEEGVVKVIFDYTDENDVVQTGHDYLAMVETNGIHFSVKLFSRTTGWNGLADNSLGDLWSGVLRVTE